MSEMTEHTEYLHRDCDRTIEELNHKLAALQSERDALREALSKLTKECFGSMGLEPELMRQLWGNTNVNILERRIAEARALLFAPASGEPARKP